MVSNTVTLALDGEIPLRKFAEAMRHFTMLLETLSAELAWSAEVNWTIEELQAGSALATARAESDDSNAIQRIVTAYDQVGEALGGQRPIPYSVKVAHEARSLAGIVGSDVTALTFQTADRETVITRRTGGKALALDTLVSHGAIKGRVQTMTSRGGLRFTLFDALNDRPINCYLHAGQDELMLGAWGSVAIVEGQISREPVTGRPLAIRQISEVTPFPEAQPGSYTMARGAVPLPDGGPTAEEAVRRVRDSWPSRA